jgi:hypothetical protein
MEYRRQGLQHIIERALKRNPFTADQPITVLVLDEDVLLYGTVNHADLIPEAVATVEAIAPFLRVHCRLRVRWVRALT